MAIKTFQRTVGRLLFPFGRSNITRLGLAYFFSTLYFYIPVGTLYLQTKNLDYVQINSLWGIIVFTQFLAEVPTGILADRIGRKHAINLALEFGSRLTFFHVMDAEFLGSASITMTSVRTIYQELYEMGVFAMLILCDRASRRGVENVDYIVRNGDIRANLYDLAVETKAEIMVMGYPTRSPGANVFKLDGLKDFAEKLEQDSGLEIILVKPDGSTT